MAFCQCADLIRCAINFLTEGNLAALQDCCQPVGERFDLSLKSGVPQLPEQGLKCFADDAVFQDIVLRDWQVCVFLRQAEEFDCLVCCRLIVGHVFISNV